MDAARCSLLAVLLSVLSVAGAAPAPQFGERLAGRAVDDVIDNFRRQEWPFVYSTSLVTRDLVVLEEPESTDPVGIVREVLAPHGLTVRNLDGVYYVVRESRFPGDGRPGSILAVVKERASGQRVSDATVRLASAVGRSVSLPDGAFQFSDLPPRQHRVIAEAEAFELQRQDVMVRPGTTTVVVFELDERETRLETMTVSASHYDFINDIQSAVAHFTRDEIANLPDLGEDPLRAVHRLPGTASSGVSARSHIRGGEQNEMLLVFDGLELLDPFHARDYQNVFSTIDQRAISSIEVYTGGFPVMYGDRLSGVMLINTLAPEPGTHHELGLSVYNTSVLSSGTFEQGRGEWVASARRGNLDLVLNPDLGEPSYSDVLAHVGLELGVSSKLSMNALVSTDDVLVVLEDEQTEQERANSDTENSQFWIKLDTGITERLSTTTVLSSSRLTNHRRGVVNDPEKIIGNVNDRRTLDILGLRQDWQLLFSETHLAKWGFQFKRMDASYDYSSAAEFFGFFAAFPSAPPSMQRRIQVSPDGETYSLYFADRFRIGERLTAELGARWDRQTYLSSGSDNQLSPRVNFLYRIGPDADLRLSWGRFFQSQPIQELQVEDGVTEFFPAQRADHTILGLEHRFANDIALRVEAFQKSMGSLRPRYENLFDPLSLMPELEPDRVRIAPDGGRTRGIEVFVTREHRGPFAWWASYSLSKVEDIIGGRDIPRSWDQRHAVDAGVSWSGEKWDLGVAVKYRTAWPTTELFLMTEMQPDGSDELEVSFGERNGARLDDFTSLDFRASRRVAIRRGALSFFVEITNLLDADNTCCVDYDVEFDDAGLAMLEQAKEPWLPRLPAVGVLWEF